jgi:hypothetical protein
MLMFGAAPHPNLLVAPEARFQRDKDGEKGKVG